jgi:hypothetical protein
MSYVRYDVWRELRSDVVGPTFRCPGNGTRWQIKAWQKFRRPREALDTNIDVGEFGIGRLGLRKMQFHVG